MSLITLEDVNKYNEISLLNLTPHDIANLPIIPIYRQDASSVSPIFNYTDNNYLNFYSEEIKNLIIKDKFNLNFKEVKLVSIEVDNGLSWYNREIKFNFLNKNNYDYTVKINQSYLSCGVSLVTNLLWLNSEYVVPVLQFIIKFIYFNEHFKNFTGHYSKHLGAQLIYSHNVSLTYQIFIDNLNKHKLLLSNTPETINYNSGNNIQTIIIDSYKLLNTEIK